MEIFGEMDSRLSRVKRWTVIPTIQTQSNAEHCFNVERIARRIAQEWFPHRPSVNLDHLSQVALHHDDDEAITGDLPSPSKWVLSETWLDKHRDLWYNVDSPEHRIVKLADKMEAFHFLVMERKLGNIYIKQYFYELKAKVVEYAFKLGAGPAAEKWVREIEQIEGTTRGSAA